VRGRKLFRWLSECLGRVQVAKSCQAPISFRAWLETWFTASSSSVEDIGLICRVLNSIVVPQKHHNGWMLFLVLPSADRKHEVGFVIFRRSERRKNIVW
jgi:hypothetical protein